MVDVNRYLKLKIIPTLMMKKLPLFLLSLNFLIRPYSTLCSIHSLRMYVACNKLFTKKKKKKSTLTNQRVVMEAYA